MFVQQNSILKPQDVFNGKWTTDGKYVTYNWVLTSEDYTKVFSAKISDEKIIET